MVFIAYRNRINFLVKIRECRVADVVVMRAQEAYHPAGLGPVFFLGQFGLSYCAITKVHCASIAHHIDRQLEDLQMSRMSRFDFLTRSGGRRRKQVHDAQRDSVANV